MRTITVPVEYRLPADLLRSSEIADRLGVGRPVIANWQSRYADFPKPRFRLFYSWKEVRAWLRKHPRYRIVRKQWNPRTRRHELIREKLEVR